MTDQFVDCCGNISYYVCGFSEELQLGGFDPVARNVGIVVDTETVRQDNILGAASFSDALVLCILKR